MKKCFFLLTLVGAMTASAGIVPLSWQTLETPITVTGTTISSDTTNGVGNAFWNNTSKDSATNCANVGCYLSGTGVFTGFAGPPPTPALPTLAYIGNDNGSTIADVSFAGTSLVQGAHLILERATNRATNWVGWYDTAADVTTFNAANYNVTWGVLFDGNDTGARNFSPTSNFGLWFLADCPLATCAVGTAGPGGSFDAVTNGDTIGGRIATNGLFSESSENKGDTANAQHFAFFARSAAEGSIIPADFWVGMEDQKVALSGAGATIGDEDYNDMVLSMRIVPEPGYYVLLVVGMAGLFMFSRKRKNVSSEASN